MPSKRPMRGVVATVTLRRCAAGMVLQLKATVEATRLQLRSTVNRMYDCRSRMRREGIYEVEAISRMHFCA